LELKRKNGEILDSQQMAKISTRFIIMDEIKLLNATLPAEILTSLTSPSTSPATPSTLTQRIDSLSPPNMDILINKVELRSSNIIPTIVTTERAISSASISVLKPDPSNDIISNCVITHTDNLAEIKNVTKESKEIASPWQVIDSSPKKSLREIQAEEIAMAKPIQKPKPKSKQIKEKPKQPVTNSSSTNSNENMSFNRSNENPWGVTQSTNKPPYIAAIICEQKTAKNFNNKEIKKLHEQPKEKTKEIVPNQDKPIDSPYWNISKPESIHNTKEENNERNFRRRKTKS